VLDLIYEAKQEADLKKEQEGGGGKAAGGGKKKLSPDEVALQRGKTKKSDIATWADWGIPPSSLTKAKELAARKKKRLGENKPATHKSKAEVPGGGSSGAEDSQAEEEPEHLGFSVFVPDEAEEGDSIEVALPNGKKMVAYVEKIAAAKGDILQSRTMPVEVAFGYDGVFYAVPPKEGYDLAKIAERKEKATAQKLLEAAKTAESLYKGASSMLSTGKEAASMLGVQVPGSN
jgi:hypothetical protein